MAEIGPIGDARIFWTSGGSDAVDLACKLSRRHWQHRGCPDRRIIATRHNAYHGLHGFGTSVAGIASNREGYGGESLIPETMRVATNNLAAVQAELAEAGADRIAAIIAEPVMTGGVIAPAPGYLQGLQRLCRANEILFIVDEVITGFGRVGSMFACDRFDLQPDMVLVAKGITSGYAPLGGVLIAPSVWEPFFSGDDAPIFRHGLTYSGHATACAVAQANLDIIESEGLVARVAELESILRQKLALLSRHPLVHEVRCNAGFLAGVKLVAEAPGEAVARASIELGVITRVISDNALQISPPFVVNEDDITTIVQTLAAALDRVAAVA